MNKNGYFIEVDSYQGYKHNQLVGGDVFLSTKIKEENRIVSVLSDGLGSGIKASVLATLTATMASRFIVNYIDIKKSAQIIMKTLPVCKERKISYSTFSIVDIESDEHIRIIEYDNPPYILLRESRIMDVDKNLIKVKPRRKKESQLYFSNFKAEMGDRIILLSDGVTQSGMGTPTMPLGWGISELRMFVEQIISENKTISARELAKRIVKKAMANDSFRCKDDITCGVIYFRKPRNIMVMTGPPISKDKDKDLAAMIDTFDGKKVICGGTTANIVARELKRDIKVNLRDIDPEIPPPASMHGIDLITEGIITLGKVAELLEMGVKQDSQDGNAAQKLVYSLLNSDIVNFVVGTKINEVHQDPNMPVELEIRRNVVKKIIKLLEEKYLKEAHLQFI